MTVYHRRHGDRVYPLGRHLYPTHAPANRLHPADGATALKTVEWARTGGVFDQGNLGSCTGNALAGWLNCPAVDGHVKTEADAVRLYERATQIDPYQGTYPPTDTGSDGESVCKAAMEDGELTGYAHAFGIDHMLSALMLGPVIVGTVWLSNMFEPDKDGVLTITGSVEGGHEYLCRRYDKDTDMLGFDNSWGSGWGVDGSFWIRRKDFAKLLKRNGDVTVPRR